MDQDNSDLFIFRYKKYPMYYTDKSTEYYIQSPEMVIIAHGMTEEIADRILTCLNGCTDS